MLSFYESTHTSWNPFLINYATSNHSRKINLVFISNIYALIIIYYYHIVRFNDCTNLSHNTREHYHKFITEPSWAFDTLSNIAVYLYGAYNIIVTISIYVTSRWASRIENISNYLMFRYKVISYVLCESL